MIAIIKYNAGNIRSVQNALNRLECPSVITDDPGEIRKADKVILPGVGEASTAMKYLRDRNLDKLLISLSQPLLGICLGLQLMCGHSEEGDTECLGIFKTDVKKFPDEDIVPHMGWNNMTKLEGKLFEGLSSSDDLYFVHSYYAELCGSTVGVCDYIKPFSASLNRNNFYATQFHPEKSAQVGEKILRNFLAL